MATLKLVLSRMNDRFATDNFVQIVLFCCTIDPCEMPISQATVQISVYSFIFFFLLRFRLQTMKILTHT